ncbi:hypothetical protein CSR02_09170 [Acetobacter pomorum]|uniref:Uncharacterized protein n=1 Tax=Acetobacter pomorum TaxID=65959 RepID=A0A2G4RBC1_9PROT|nr:hypothetical protein AZ09_06235 [Acetobacter aceti 1023]PHY93853.1 hypothetical protein CSR02_09170 [Acetobacter pomorum]
MRSLLYLTRWLGAVRALFLPDLVSKPAHLAAKATDVAQHWQQSRCLLCKLREYIHASMTAREQK